MASPQKKALESTTNPEHGSEAEDEQVAPGQGLLPATAGSKLPHTSDIKGEELQTDPDEPATMTKTPSTPDALAAFDWEDFEMRFEQALREADQHELDILKEAESLSRYFKIWASAASSHDDERAAKRLQTRRRFVNLSEETMAQKQQHYEEVVRAFESALALLRSK